MRGSLPGKEYNLLVMKAALMSRYNQQYSEIVKMPYKDVLFLMALLESEEKFTKQELEKQQQQIKRMRR